MNKIRVAKATVNGKESLILIVVDPDGRKMCMIWMGQIRWHLIFMFQLDWTHCSLNSGLCA